MRVVSEVKKSLRNITTYCRAIFVGISGLAINTLRHCVTVMRAVEVTVNSHRNICQKKLKSYNCLNFYLAKVAYRNPVTL